MPRNASADIVAEIVVARASAFDAVTALERHLSVLRGACDALAAEGRRVPSDELRHALRRASSALYFLSEELAVVQIVENHLAQLAHRPGHAPS